MKSLVGYGGYFKLSYSFDYVLKIQPDREKLLYDI